MFINEYKNLTPTKWTTLLVYFTVLPLLICFLTMQFSELEQLQQLQYKITEMCTLHIIS